MKGLLSAILIFNICVTIGARVIHLKKGIEVQFMPFSASSVFDSYNETYLVEEGKNINIRCKVQLATPCILSIYHGISPIVINDGLADNDTRYTYIPSSFSEALAILSIHNATSHDSGVYTCACRKPKSRTQLFSKSIEPEITYQSSLAVTVVRDLPQSAICSWTTSEVLINDTFQLKCNHNESVLVFVGANKSDILAFFKNETIELSRNNFIIRASNRLNDARFCCLGKRKEKICSFPPITVHEELRANIVFPTAVQETNYVSLECTTVPQTRNITWEISMNTSIIGIKSQIPFQINVIYDKRKSYLTLSNLPTNVTEVIFTCAATIHNHKSVAMVSLDNIKMFHTDSNILSNDNGFSGQSGVSSNFIYVIFICIPVFSLILTVFVIITAVAFYWREKKAEKLSTNTWDRESLFTITSNVDSNDHDDDDRGTPNRRQGDNMIAVTSEWNMNLGSSELQDNYIEVNSRRQETSTDESGDTDITVTRLEEEEEIKPLEDGLILEHRTQWILRSNGRVTPVLKPRHKSLRSKLYQPSPGKKVRFASKSVIVRSSSRRSSLFDEDDENDTVKPIRSISLFDALSSEKRTENAGGGDHETIGQWMRSRSQEELPTTTIRGEINGNTTKPTTETSDSVNKAGENITKHVEQPESGNTENSEIEPIYAFPDKLRTRSNRTIPESVGKDNKKLDAHLNKNKVEMNMYPLDSSPDILSQSRMNKWRDKGSSSDA